MRAVIASGGKQYLVSKGDVINVELVGDQKTLTFEPLMIEDGKNSVIGSPTVKGAVVKAKLKEEIRSPKVTSIRYKAKKRVHKRRGHKQKLSVLEITDITTVK